MNSNVEIGKSARRIPAHRVIPRLLKDPIPALEHIGEETAGEIVRLDLGLFRPYLVTRPEHVQHVLRDHHERYVRDGMFWKPLRRLLGNGILGFGPQWRSSRRILQPLFTHKHVNSILAEMIDAIVDAVARFEAHARSGQPVEATVEMTRIVHRAVSRVFFGDRISEADFGRLAPAIDTAANSVSWRMLMPFVPMSVPMPGDRAFWRSVRTIDDVMIPLIRAARQHDTVRGDIVSTLCHARREDGEPLGDVEVRDDVVAMFSAGTETTAVTLSWLWLALSDHPEVAERLYEEVARVVGSSRIAPEHIPHLRYTRMVVQELIRFYSPGWIVPRQAVEDDVIDDVRIPAGATVLISPYVTHRMTWLWEAADTFDPGRFAPEREATRHRSAYFPFGGGPHQCIGNHFFTAEAQVIVAAVLSKYRPEILNASPVTPKPAASLRPRQSIEMRIRSARPGAPTFDRTA
jgi:cytochrome P450